MSQRDPLRLPTRDPFTGGDVVVTRLETASGVAIEGRFSLGWVGRLTPQQLDFVGLLLERRNNLQKLAADLGIAYNTARSRFEEIVTAMGAPPDDGSVAPPASAPSPAGAAAARRREILRRVAAGELDVDAAHDELRGPTG
ncbi:MAG TPA: DUF2089 family protein [Acidimicrobiales bacterium]